VGIEFVMRVSILALTGLESSDANDWSRALAKSSLLLEFQKKQNARNFSHNSSSIRTETPISAITLIVI
jgi:hypothetical protein